MNFIIKISFALLVFPSFAFAACTVPSGDHGDMLYNRDHTVMQYCNGTNWVSMDASHSGGADNLGNHTATEDLDMAAFKVKNAAIPTASADVANKAYVDAAVASAAGTSTVASPTCYYTNGSCAEGFSQVDGIFRVTGYASADHNICCSNAQASGNGNTDSNGIKLGGYFVMTAQTYNGNLGGLDGANAKCLTELQTHPWKSKGSAGTLTASRVKAFLCDGTSCNNLNPYTRYAFALARSVGMGGQAMTTDDQGRGPGDSANWNGNGYFGDRYQWWSNRDSGNGTTLWATTRDGNNHCANWTGTTTNGRLGYANSSDSVRWKYGSTIPSCNSSYPLICFVNPAE